LKTLLPIGLKTKPKFNPYGNPGFSFFIKIIETSYCGNWFLFLGKLKSRFLAQYSPNAIHGGFSSKNWTENQDENQIPL